RSASRTTATASATGISGTAPSRATRRGDTIEIDPLSNSARPCGPVRILGLASNRETITPASICQSSDQAKDVIVAISSVPVDPSQHVVGLQTGQRMLNTNSVMTQTAILCLLLGRERMPTAGPMRLVEQLVGPVFLDAL